MIIEIIGWIGTGMVLLAYLLVSTGKITSTNISFQLLNALCAIGIIINSLSHKAIPSVALNVIWLVIAVYALLKAQSRHTG